MPMSRPLCRLLLATALAAMTLLGACHSSRSTSSRKKRDIKLETTQIKKSDKNVHPIIAEARSWLGTPYKYGGQSRRGTDCSGMVMQVFLTQGIKLPRDSRSQCSFCKKIKRNELMVGDLVFFATKKGGSRVGHVGIYMGDDEFIHSSSSRGVIVSKLSEPYYTSHFYSAGRVPGLNVRIKAVDKNEDKAADSKKKKRKSSAPAPQLPDTAFVEPEMQGAFD